MEGRRSMSSPSGDEVREYAMPAEAEQLARQSEDVPDAVLGGLLLFSGLELALSSKPQEYRDGDLFLVLLMAAVGVALNPAAAFAVGLPLAYALKQSG